MDKLRDFVEFMEGKKFYLGLVFAFALWLGWVQGWWSLEEVKALLALDGIFLGWAWRSAVSKI